MDDCEADEKIREGRVSAQVEKASGRLKHAAMLVAYLDDSGTDDGSPVVTLAGYVGIDDAWRAFARDVASIFDNYGVGVLHAKDFHDTRGAFKGWPADKKSNFVADLYMEAKQRLILGISISIRKKSYVTRKKETRIAQCTSPYGYCFNLMLDKLLKTSNSAPLLFKDGMSFVLEAGNRNDNDVSRIFDEVCRRYDLGGILKLGFADKREGPAIQIADFLAFYSRRHAVECERHNTPMQAVGILSSVQEILPHYMLVATDFHS